MHAIEVTVTCGSVDEARRIMRAAVEARLAACAQTWPVESCYRWEGAIADDHEHLVLFKSADAHFSALCELIRSHHSYDVPAIAAVAVAAAGPGYLDWLVESTGADPVT